MDRYMYLILLARLRRSEYIPLTNTLSMDGFTSDLTEYVYQRLSPGNAGLGRNFNTRHSKPFDLLRSIG